MQNFTVVMLNESVSKKDIESYFGNSLLSINQMSNYDQAMSDVGVAMASQWTEDSASSCESVVSSTTWSSFVTRFAPSVKKYSERSYLLKSTTTASRVGWEVVKGQDLQAPLYFNQALDGWVTSVKNESLVTTLSTVSKTSSRKPRKASTRSVRASTRSSKRLSGNSAKKTESKRTVKKSTRTRRTSKRTSKSKSVGELSGFSFSNYKNGLLLVSGSGQSEGEKYFHGGYWNKSLGGWVFSKKKAGDLVSLGATKQ